MTIHEFDNMLYKENSEALHRFLQTGEIERIPFDESIDGVAPGRGILGTWEQARYIAHIGPESVRWSIQYFLAQHPDWVLGWAEDTDESRMQNYNIADRLRAAEEAAA